MCALFISIYGLHYLNCVEIIRRLMRIQTTKTQRIDSAAAVTWLIQPVVTQFSSKLDCVLSSNKLPEVQVHAILAALIPVSRLHTAPFIRLSLPLEYQLYLPMNR